MTRQLEDRIEAYTAIIPGHCTFCGKKYDKVTGSSCTCNRNGDRYARDKTTAWGAFRCRGCHAVIEDAWVPDSESTL